MPIVSKNTLTTISQGKATNPPPPLTDVTSWQPCGNIPSKLAAKKKTSNSKPQKIGAKNIPHLQLYCKLHIYLNPQNPWLKRLGFFHDNKNLVNFLGDLEQVPRLDASEKSIESWSVENSKGQPPFLEGNHGKLTSWGKGSLSH